MKITDIDAFAIRYPLAESIADSAHELSMYELAVVRVHTDEGIVGHGFNSGIHGGAVVVAATVQEMIAPILPGKDPFHVRGLWEDMYWRTQVVGRSGVTRLAMATVEMALWDVMSQSLGVPLWKLLGGTDRDRIPLYCTDAGWLSLPLDDMIGRMKKVLDAGFCGVKMKIGSPNPADDLRRVEAARTALGPDARLMVDINCHWDLPTALRWGPELDAFDIAWLEEPLNPHDVQGHARLGAVMRAPLLVGESISSLTLWRDYFEQGAVGLAQPDVTRLGGISRWMDVASLARAYNMRVVPACWDTMQVSAHLAAACPECHLMEHLNWTLDVFEQRLVIEDGHILIPQEPGIGARIRPDVVERYRVR